MANSKSIGNNFERETAKRLSLWLTDNKDDDVCWRDLGSGSRHTQRKKVGKETKRQGDFVATDLNYQWFFDAVCVDSKSYQEFNPLFINEKNIKSNSIFKQWLKLLDESENKIPMMVVKIRDRKTPEFIMLPIWVNFPAGSDLTLMVQSFNKDSYGYGKDCVIVVQEEFFSKVTAKDFTTLNIKAGF